MYYSKYDAQYDSIDFAAEAREREALIEQEDDERRARFLDMTEDEQEEVIAAECREARLRSVPYFRRAA